MGFKAIVFVVLGSFINFLTGRKLTKGYHGGIISKMIIFGKVLVFLLGIATIYWGLTLSKEEQKKTRWIDQSYIHTNSLVEWIMLLIVSNILGKVPLWVIKFILIIIGIIFALLGIIVIL